MFSDATSGLKAATGFSRSSTVMVGAPPVVMLMTQSDFCLITLRNGANASRLWSGRPSCGFRACRCTSAAPASAAPIAASAISEAVIGRCGDIVGRVDGSCHRTGDHDFTSGHGGLLRISRMGFWVSAVAHPWRGVVRLLYSADRLRGAGLDEIPWAKGRRAADRRAIDINSDSPYRIVIQNIVLL